MHGIQPAIMPRLTIQRRQTVIELQRDGNSYNKIVKIMKDEHDISITRRAVRNLCQVSIAFYM